LPRLGGEKKTRSYEWNSTEGGNKLLLFPYRKEKGKGGSRGEQLEGEELSWYVERGPAVVGTFITGKKRRTISRPKV